MKLFNDSDKVNLSIANGNLKNANASTIGTAITISNSFLKSATNLSITLTMIHEMVHAYLNVKYSSPQFFDPNNGYEFRLKMDQFAIDNGFNPNGSDVEKAIFYHEFMGQYVDAMAASLLIWDEQYGSKTIITKLSWKIDYIIRKSFKKEQMPSGTIRRFERINYSIILKLNKSQVIIKPALI